MAPKIQFCQKWTDKFLHFPLQFSKLFLSFHYENMPMQYTENFLSIKKMKILSEKKIDIFLIVAQNIDCGYTLEPPRVPTIYVLEQK